MAFLYKSVSEASDYGIRNWVRQGRDPEEYKSKLATSTTVYVGNLSFYTTEEQVWELFSKVGEVKRIIMGLNQFSKTPCGFCFVEYFTHEAAMDCVNLISGTILDERTIRADWDTGFEEGRQFGRGKTGGQVRDDYRTDFDPERGGAGGRPTHSNDRNQGGRYTPNNKRDRSGDFKHHDRYQGESNRSNDRSHDGDASRNRDYGHKESGHRHDDRDYKDRERDREGRDRYRERERGPIDRRDGRDDYHDRHERHDRYDSRNRRHDNEEYRAPQKDAFGRDIPPPESSYRDRRDFDYPDDRDAKRPKYN